MTMSGNPDVFLIHSPQTKTYRESKTRLSYLCLRVTEK